MSSSPQERRGSAIFRRIRSMSSPKASIIDSAQRNDVQEVRTLCRKTKRQSLNETDDEQRTALHVAAREGHGGMVEMLLSFKADCNKRDRRGWSPLHEACASKSPQSIDIARILLNVGGAHADALTNQGVSPLHLFLQRAPAPADFPQFLQAVDLMLEKGAKINSQSMTGETPLHQACVMGEGRVVAALLDRHADINQRTQDGESALHIAIRLSKVDIVKLLLERSANPKAQSNNGSIEEYCQRYQLNEPDLEELFKEASYSHQARLMSQIHHGKKNHTAPSQETEGPTTLQINLDVVSRLEKKGYRSASIVSAIFTLHRAGLPTDDDQLISNEIDNGSESRTANECQICMDESINSVLLPCRHSTLCIGCANDIQQTSRQCPMCQQPVEDVLQLYTP